MKTSPECIDCFKHQISYCSSLASPSQVTRKTLCSTAESLLDEFDFCKSPPVNAMSIYSSIYKESGNPDPYLNLKKQSTELAQAFRPKAQAVINDSSDPLYTSALLSIAGNIIDYGSHQTFDLETTIKNVLTQKPTINHFNDLRCDLQTAGSILYLGDNCGEIVFDGLFIEQIPAPVTLALKQSPIINDALVSDAYLCGLNSSCNIISNGTACPGTPLETCSSEFNHVFYEADVVISKGQGNFETLSDVNRTIYFLLTVKCDVVAGHIKHILNHSQNICMGDSIILRKQGNL